MLTDPGVCIPPLLSDLSLLFSPLSLCFEPSDSQVLAQLLWVTICYPQWKSEAFIQKVATLDLWPWCLPPCCSPPFSVSMELNSQVEKWEQANSIAIHGPPHSPSLPLPRKKRERKMNKTHSSISRRWRRKPYWLKSKLRNREGNRGGVPGKKCRGGRIWCGVEVVSSQKPAPRGSSIAHVPNGVTYKGPTVPKMNAYYLCHGFLKQECT